MKKLFLLVAGVATWLLWAGCGERPDSARETPNPWIVACTGGATSVEAVIKVRLAQACAVDERTPEQLRGLFTFSPSVAGEAFWVDDHTVGFRPAKRLKSGTEYRVRFAVGRLFAEAKGADKTFRFSFTTIQPSFRYHIEGLKLYDDNAPECYVLQGFVQPADVIDDGQVERLLEVDVDGRPTTVRWRHGESGYYDFTIDSLPAREAPYPVLLRWSGKAIGYDFRTTDTVTVPQKGVFQLLDVRVNADNNSIECLFSQPLDARQKFASYVQAGSLSSLRFMASSNKLEIQLPHKPSSPIMLTIREGLRAKSGAKLADDYRKELVFEALKPLVRAVGKGVIMPNSSGLTLPFQAASLRAVDVLVYRTYETNMLQFLQVNTIDSRHELRRVAKPVARKTIRLDENKSLDLQQWNTFSIDMSSIISPEPGALYTVKIAFSQRYSLYGDCPGSEPDDDGETPLADDQAEADGDYYYDDDDYYFYYGSENPCYRSYYNNSRFVLQNILATDIGLVAKLGHDGQYHVFVSNLVTAQPMSGVRVTAYNYQQQPAGEALSDGHGVARVSFTERPYVIVAQQGLQKSYLRVDPGQSLSLSTFDVSGTSVERGLKGYIYGERGVWRPGDTLFLTFVLEDRTHTLPAAHPVTFELYNAVHQLVSKQVRTEGSNGFYTFSCPTDPEAPTGNWNASVKVGGVTFVKTLRVATIKPNRLKIDTKLDHDPVASGQAVSGTIAARWLHGAPTAGNEADISVHLAPVRTTFKNYSDYRFDDLTKEFPGSDDESHRGRLDENGVLRFRIPVETHRQAAGKLRAAIAVRVFEEGGEYSADHFSVEVSPYDAYVGLKMPAGVGYYNRLEANTDQLFEVVALDAAGRPLRRKLEVEIFRNEWNWWWFSSDGNLANYSYRLYNDRLFATKVHTDASGRGSFTYKLEYPEWGLLLVRVTDPESGHSTTGKAYIDWWGYGRGEDNGNAGAAILAFQTDKDKYLVGEKAVVTIPSNKGAQAIVTVENGSRVMSSLRIDCKDSETAITIPTTAEMCPNAYISVTLLQPHRQTNNDLPMRLYGVIPLMVENPATRIRPTLKMPDIIRPAQPFSVSVSEADGKEMTYTLAIVDEGLLDLTRFKTPDLWEHFFQREALGVLTWDLYNAVMGAYGGKIEQLFAIGGDGLLEQSAKGNDKANRFKPVVKFVGPFTLKNGKTGEHRFTISNYVGAVRAMVVAGNGTAYGKAETTTPVRSPLMVQATLPRVVGPGEELTLPAAIFAMEPQVKNVKITLIPGELFEPIDGAARSLAFAQPGDELVKFRLRVKNKLGVARVKVIATSGNERAENEIEINVRAANPSVVTAEHILLNGRQSATLNVALPGIEGTNFAQLEASSIPPLNLGMRLQYLLQYPHGCLEQTTSGAFPQLFLPAVVDMSDSEKERAAHNVKAALLRLSYFVKQDGSLSYWPGGAGYTCEWTNNYAGHFLLEAERKGYSLPGNLKENWLSYQQKAARNWNASAQNDRYYYSQNDLIQAYRLYVLALAGKEELSAMNRLKERADLSAQAKWMLAGAYVLAGQKEAALKLVNDLPADANDTYRGTSDTYGSADRDEAIILDVLTLLGAKENAFRMAKRLSDAMNTARWMSTQTTAYCLLALSKYALDEKGDLEFAYQTGNGKQTTVKSNKSLWQIDLNEQRGTTASVKIDNRGDNALFVRLSVRGIPASGKEKAAEHDLSVAVRYLKPDGTELDVTRLAQGTDFMAEVRVKNPGQRGDYVNLALTQILPSGWEITDNRMDDIPASDHIANRDIRDDRVLTYFDLHEGQSLTVRVNLRAAYTGRYYLPAVSCEAMYDASISANTVGKQVVVF